MVVAEIEGSTSIHPLRATTISDAYRAGATRFVHGYFTQRGGLRFQIEVEDAATHKMTVTAAADGEPLTAMNRVAKILEPSAHPFSTSNAEALAAWGRGENERAVSIDADFGAAWLGWIQKLAAEGNPQRATEVAAQALGQTELRSPMDRAQIEIAAAALRHDTDGQLQGLLDLSRLEPADTSLLEGLAAGEVAARKFPDAVAHYQTLERLTPRTRA